MILLWTVGSALAATLLVSSDGTTPYSSIPQAIAAAADGDTIEVGPGVWSGGLYVGSKALTIRSSDGADATFLVASGEPVVQAWGTLSLSGFTIQSSFYRGVEIWGGEAHLSELVFDDIVSAADGGALLVSGATAHLSDSVISGGQARGGTIYASSAALTLSDVEISGATASYGAGLYAEYSDVTFERVALEQNYAYGDGGGVNLYASSLAATDATFYANITDYGHGVGIYGVLSEVSLAGGGVELNYSTNYEVGYTGGGIYLSDSALSAEGTTFTDNFAAYGGAIRALGSGVTLSGVELSGNYATYGGAVYLDAGSSLTDTDSLWSDNTSYSHGGALYGYDRFTLDVVGSTFEANTATYGYGGAVMGQSTGELRFEGASFVDNTAYYYGGAVMSYYSYGADRYSGCTFTDNTATYSGGGAIAQYGYSDAVIVESSFSGNEASGSDGGAVYGYYSGLDIQQGTFTGNRSLSGNGGAVYSYYAAGNGAILSIVDSDFVSNTAHYSGGAVASVYNTVALTGSRFVVNDTDAGGMGGAVFSSYTYEAEISSSQFAGNNAGYGGAFYSEDASGAYGPERWHNNVFQENTARIGGAGVFVRAAAAEATNNTFVGNSANDEAGSVALVESPLLFTNNLLAFSTSGAALHTYDEASGQGTIAYNTVYEVTDGGAGGMLDEALLAGHDAAAAAPGLAAYTPDGDPDNDRFVLLRDSALVDAGDPKILDVDGSRSDIGALGGPGVIFEDADGDGVDSWIDCDDADAAARPGAAEVYYDGRNQDCLIGSDYDADGDGADSADYGGDDCDDEDPAIQHDCPTPDTGSAPEDGDPLEAPPSDRGGGCTHLTGQPAGGLLLLVGIIGMRRRRGGWGVSSG